MSDASRHGTMDSRSRIAIVAAVLLVGLAAWLLRSGDKEPLGPVESPISVAHAESRGNPALPAFREPIRPRPFDARSESAPVAAETRPADGTAALTVHVIWGDDKQPAAGVSVHAIEWGARSGMWKMQDPVTGVDGTFRMTGVAPGKVGFYIDRGGGKTVDVVGGDDQDVILEIPAGPVLDRSHRAGSRVATAHVRDPRGSGDSLARGRRASSGSAMTSGQKKIRTT